MDRACCDEALPRAVESLWKKRFVADVPIPPQTLLLFYSEVLYQCSMGQDCPSVLLYMMHSNNNYNYYIYILGVPCCVGWTSTFSVSLLLQLNLNLITLCTVPKKSNETRV